jgi:hypothetical protein
MPVTAPDVLTVPTAAVLLLHVPPVDVVASVITDCSQTVPGPVIVAGSGLTVTTAVLKHPLAPVYVIVAVPDETPVTTPPPVTVATNILLLDHAPPAPLVNVVVEFTHTLSVPLIAEGSELTVTTCLT